MVDWAVPIKRLMRMMANKTQLNVFSEPGGGGGCCGVNCIHKPLAVMKVRVGKCVG
jgi:hypothetical protein